MINRVILMKLNAMADEPVIATMQDYVARIGGEMEEVRAYHLAPNQSAGEGDYNWVLSAAFSDNEAMNTYRVAPLHQEFVAFCDPYTEDFLAVSYEAPAA